MEKKIDIGQLSKVEIQWNVQPVDYSVEKADEIRSKMALKYGIPKKNIHINPNFIKKNKLGETEVATAEIAQNIQDPKFQQTLFRKYLDDNEIVNYNFDTILSIDNVINSTIDYTRYDKYRRYTIEWVRWSNFLSYGENNYIDFSDLSGLVLLKSEPANQGGKTNFACDLIKFLLFGSGDEGKSDVLKNMFNKHLPDATEIKVEGGIEIDGEHYIIKRTVTRPQRKRRTDKSAVTQKVEYFRVVDGTEIELEDIDNLEEESNTKTNQIIKEAIGNKKDFNLVVLANSDNLKALISMKDKERGSLLTRWIGLAPLEEKFDKANDKWLHEIKPALLSGKYNKDELVAFVQTTTSEIKSLNDAIVELEKKLLNCESNIATYNTDKDNLVALRQFVDASLANVDLQTKLTEQQRLLEEGKGLASRVQLITKEIDEIGEIVFSNDEYEALIDQKVTISNNITKIKYEIQNLKKDIENLKKGEVCYACGQRLNNVDNSAKILQKEKEVQELIANGIAQKEILDQVEVKLANIKLLKEQYDEKNKKLIKKSTLEVDLAKKREEYIAVKSIIDGLKKYEEAIEHNNRINTNLNVLNEKIKYETKIKESLIAERENYKNNITILTNQISQYEVIINKLAEEEVLVRSWELYLLMVGKNGISKMVLRQTLPIINAELNNLLNDVCDFNVLVEIDDSNHINFSLIADDVKSNLLSGSGFEQTVAALALRAVLGNISTLPRPSFMLLDEVLGGVAKDNYENVKKLYDRILKDYSFIFQITHLDDIADWHETTVVVKKENRISSISVVK
jgi:DNA repair exonuclease SbcCD ATPase subunit